VTAALRRRAAIVESWAPRVQGVARRTPGGRLSEARIASFDKLRTNGGGVKRRRPQLKISCVPQSTQNEDRSRRSAA
jgi:hypothetical protein